jgi:hypothetical protein
MLAVPGDSSQPLDDVGMAEIPDGIERPGFVVKLSAEVFVIARIS